MEKNKKLLIVSLSLVVIIAAIFLIFERRKLKAKKLAAALPLPASAPAPVAKNKFASGRNNTAFGKYVGDQAPQAVTLSGSPVIVVRSDVETAVKLLIDRLPTDSADLSNFNNAPVDIDTLNLLTDYYMSKIRYQIQHIESAYYFNKIGRLYNQFVNVDYKPLTATQIAENLIWFDTMSRAWIMQSKQDFLWSYLEYQGLTDNAHNWTLKAVTDLKTGRYPARVDGYGQWSPAVADAFQLHPDYFGLGSAALVKMSINIFAVIQERNSDLANAKQQEINIEWNERDFANNFNFARERIAPTAQEIAAAYADQQKEINTIISVVKIIFSFI